MRYFVINNKRNIDEIKKLGIEYYNNNDCGFICYNDNTKEIYTTYGFIRLVVVDVFIKVVKESLEEDIVNSPNHYKSGRLETIENIKNSLSDEGFKGYLKGNIIKYTCRAELKNGIEDLDKAIKHIEFLKEEL